jgi:subtilisin
VKKFALIALAVLTAGGLAASAPPVAPLPREVPGRITLPPDELQARQIVTGMDVSEEAVDWGLANLNCPEAWKTSEGSGVLVAVLDTGCDPDHRDLKNQIKASKDFTGSRSGTMDRQGHGTHCCGVVAAELNGWGMCGVARKSKLLVGKVLDDGGSGSVDGIAAGIDWAVANNADVISMSLGGAGRDGYIPPALAKAEAEGVIVLAAAGNEGPREGTTGYPAGYPQCIAVAATDANNSVAKFSSRGPVVYVTAPGVNVRSCYPGPGDGLFSSMSGTSMATPHVAGLAALWVAAHPEIPKKDRPAAFRKALKDACKDLPPAGRDTATGWGLPDAAKLVKVEVPVPMPKDPEPWVITIPPEFVGRKIKRIVIEFEKP